MTSGNDKKGPPPGRPTPQRPAGPATGGAAARPAPRPAPPPASSANRAVPGPRPAAPPPRPAANYAGDEDKTSALDISSLGLDMDEATMASDGASLRARAAAAPVDEEKTTAINLADLPPDDEPRRPAQKTILGHPAPRAAGGPVRGGASGQPPRPSAPAPAAPFDEEKTTALSIADIDKIDALPPKPAPRAAPAPVDEEKTTALSIADIDKIDALPPKPAPKPAAAAPARPAPAPARPAAPPVAKPAPKPAPTAIAEDERTMAVNLDDVARLDAGRSGAKPMPSAIAEDERTMAVNLDDVKLNELPRKPAALAKAAAKAAPVAQAAAEVSDEKTTAMSLDDIDKLDMALPRRRAEAAPASAPARSAAPAPRGPTPSDAEGFVGDIAYALEHDALEAQIESGKASGVNLDAARKSAGYKNLIIIGAAVAVVITVVGLIW